MIVYSSVTGVLNIYGPSCTGYLYFRDSVLYHVEYGPASGIEALAELFELNRASFSFVSESVCEQESLYGTVSTHMQIAEQLSSRWRQIRAYIPHLDLVPELVCSHEAALRRAWPGHYPLLAALDGRANLRQIATALGWSPIDTAEAMAQMSLDGLVDLRAARQSQHQDDTSCQEQDAAHEGIFDRIRSRTQPKSPAVSEADAQRLQPARPADPAPRGSSEEMILRLLRGSS